MWFDPAQLAMLLAASCDPRIGLPKLIHDDRICCTKYFGRNGSEHICGPSLE